jgi:hypothetical protein
MNSYGDSGGYTLPQALIARSYHGMTLRPAIDFPSVALTATAKT